MSEHDGAWRPARIDVAPADGLMDEPFSVVVRGLDAAQPVTLRSEATSDNGDRWTAWATFQPAPDGTVAVSGQAPTAGTFATADPSGLIWSMQPPREPEAGGAVDPFGSGLAPVEVKLTAEVAGHTVAETTLRRRWLAAGVTRTEVRDGGMVATYFRPAGAGPYPGVIVVGGSGGGLSELAPALMAARGFATLTLAYFGIEPLPLDLIDIPLEYFDRAIDWLLSQPGVAPGGVGFVGTSRGGELVLLLGSRLPRIKAVVGYVPSSVVNGGIGRGEARPGNPRAAWTHQGKPVPFLPPAQNRPPESAEVPPGGIPLTPIFLSAMADEAAAQAASIPVEQIRGAVLLVSGEDDQMWPSSMFARRIMARLEQARHPYPCAHLAYAGAGHRISVPNVPTRVNRGLHPVRRRIYAYGGEPAASAAARADSWPRVLAFLKENLPGG